MDSLSETAERILEIESRQDEALEQLAELERRIEQVLAEHLPLAAGERSTSGAGAISNASPSRATKAA
jgi:hypothetical protein